MMGSRRTHGWKFALVRLLQELFNAQWEAGHHDSWPEKFLLVRNLWLNGSKPMRNPRSRVSLWLDPLAVAVICRESHGSKGLDNEFATSPCVRYFGAIHTFPHHSTPFKCEGKLSPKYQILSLQRQRSQKCRHTNEGLVDHLWLVLEMCC